MVQMGVWGEVAGWALGDRPGDNAMVRLLNYPTR